MTLSTTTPSMDDLPIEDSRSAEELFLSGEVDLVVYSKPHCVQCTATYRALLKNGVRFAIINSEQASKAQEKEFTEIVNANHYTQAPISVLPNGETWTGFRPDLVAKVVELQVA